MKAMGGRVLAFVLAAAQRAPEMALKLDNRGVLDKVGSVALGIPHPGAKAVLGGAVKVGKGLASYERSRSAN